MSEGPFRRGRQRQECLQSVEHFLEQARYTWKYAELPFQPHDRLIKTSHQKNGERKGQTTRLLTTQMSLAIKSISALDGKSAILSRARFCSAF